MRASLRVNISIATSAVSKVMNIELFLFGNFYLFFCLTLFLFLKYFEKYFSYKNYL